MAKYIKKEDAIKLLVNEFAFGAATIIEKMPNADVQETKHAYYEVVPNQHKPQAEQDVRCSNCQRVLKRKKENYCPHCGAKMDGAKNE